MFGWLNRRNRELEELRQQVAVLKAAQPAEMVAGTTGGGFMGDGGKSLGAAREQLAHYRGWQYVAIRAIANRVAGLDIYVARQPAAPPSGMVTKTMGNDLEPLPSHALLDAIDDPNEIMVRHSLLAVTVGALELTGRAFWWMRDTGEKLQLWPVPPSWMTPDHKGGLYARWLMRPPGMSEPIPLDGDDVCYFSLPDPADPLGATSPLGTQALAVNADEAIQTAQNAAFRNGIHPSVILKAGRMTDRDGRPMDMRRILTPEQRTQLISCIKQAFGGVMKRGEAAIVDGLIEDIVKFSLTPAEMDFLDSGKQTKSRIFQAYGVNPLIVGEIEGANRAQAVVAEESFCSNVINPLTTLMGQVMTAWVAPRFARGGERLKVWFAPARARDDELESRNWNLALQRGAVTVNEYRKRILNLPPIDGGDELLAPQAVAPEVKALVGDLNPYSMKRLGAGTNGSGRLA